MAEITFLGVGKRFTFFCELTVVMKIVFLVDLWRYLITDFGSLAIKEFQYFCSLLIS